MSNTFWDNPPVDDVLSVLEVRLKDRDLLVYALKHRIDNPCSSAISAIDFCAFRPVFDRCRPCERWVVAIEGSSSSMAQTANATGKDSILCTECPDRSEEQARRIAA
mmetsp:Transcript_46070/g.84448  ORF Transcript_46070/g.84448 Transcript_46070/m.84448 type:complete len:107 (-) Transcript_46070:34-354(-)